MIEVNNISKTFPLSDGNELVAVDNVSFKVATGEVFGLLGPNGAGKTTTIRIMLGLIQPTSGYASILGRRSDQQPREVKRRVGLVSASAGVYPWSTTREILLYFAELYGVPTQMAEIQLKRLAELFDLHGYLDRHCQSLSTGQRQRVNLARALIHNPPVVLLDEPTLGLDVLGSQVVGEFISHLQREGRATILCTHRLDEAQRLCTHIGLLNRGRFVCEGTFAELCQQTGCTSLLEVFLKLTKWKPSLQMDGKLLEA